jgi:hypothetical protein
MIILRPLLTTGPRGTGPLDDPIRLRRGWGRGGNPGIGGRRVEPADHVATRAGEGLDRPNRPYATLTAGR